MMWSKLKVGNEMAKVLTENCSFRTIRAEQMIYKRTISMYITMDKVAV